MVSSSTKTLYLIGNKQKTDRKCIYSIEMSESVSHQNVMLKNKLRFNMQRI